MRRNPLKGLSLAVLDLCFAWHFTDVLSHCVKIQEAVCLHILEVKADLLSPEGHSVYLPGAGHTPCAFTPYVQNLIMWHGHVSCNQKSFCVFWAQTSLT